MNARSVFAWMRSVAARAAEMIGRRRFEDELDDELRFHLELETEANVRLGMSPDEARRVALVSFGGVRRYTQEARDRRGFIAVDDLVRDFRFAVRRLRRAPTFAAGVIATLAIGLTAAVGIGTLVFDVLLRELPYDRPETLARILIRTPGLGTSSTESSDGLFVYIRERSRSFASLGTYYSSEGVTITEGDQPEHTTAAMLSPSVLEMLGVRPVVGRLLRDEDARTDPVPVMISHDVWLHRFAGDPAVAGKTIELNRGRRVIVGVLPRHFDFPSPSTGVWYPDVVSATRAGLNARHLSVIGRLRPGATVQAAEAELRGLMSRLSDRFPEVSDEAVLASGLTATVQTLADATVASARGELALLGIMATVVLLIATANVATLFLLRAERLRGEVAVSRALGASRGALTRRFVAEGLVIGVASGVVALPFVAAMIATKFGLAHAQIPRLHEVTLSPGMFATGVVLVVVIGTALGLIAAARASGGGVADQLRGATHATREPRWHRAQRGLVVTQVASAFALLVGAALMGQSLWRLQHVDLGFRARDAVTFEAVLPYRPYPRYQDGVRFHLSVMEALAAVPGVTGTTAAMVFPFDAEIPGLRQRLVTDGEGGTRESTAQPNMVPPNYFQAMGIPIRSGRSFAPGDLIAPKAAIIISAALAADMFGAEDPVGRELRLTQLTRYPAYRVVGVVGDVYGERIPDGVMRTIYFPLLADIPVTPIDSTTRERPLVPYSPGSMRFVVRTELPAAAVLPAIRQIVRAVDPKVPVLNVATLDEIIARATARTRLTMVLLALAAAAALLLSAVGLYSVIAYAVAGRGREFGLRLALGATPESILALVLRDGLAMVGIGVVVGLAASLAGSRLIRGLLYEVRATNAATYIVGAVVVILAATLATYLPARMAARSDPATALRLE